MKKYNTIIFVPHARARFRQLTISTRFLGRRRRRRPRVLLVAAVAFGWAFFASVAPGPAVPARHGRERAARGRPTATLHQRLDGISKQLSDFEARTRRLAIVAGLTDSVRGGLGGPAAGADASSDLAGAERSLSSRLVAAREPVLPPLELDRVDPDGLARPRRCQLRLRRPAGSLHGSAGVPRRRRHLDRPQRARSRHGRRRRHAQRLGRRIRQGHRPRPRRSLRNALRPPRGRLSSPRARRSTAATESASSARPGARRRRTCTTRCTSTGDPVNPLEYILETR